MQTHGIASVDKAIPATGWSFMPAIHVDGGGERREGRQRELGLPMTIFHDCVSVQRREKEDKANVAMRDLPACEK